MIPEEITTSGCAQRSPLGWMSRVQFVASVKYALDQNTGFATGKLGTSEVQRLAYSVAAARVGRDAKVLRLLQPNLIFHSLKQSGLFPPDPEFYLRFNQFYGEQMRSLDCLGVFPELLANTQPVIAHYGLEMPLIHFNDQEPDRSVPSQDEKCYLPHFRDKKILIVCSFAELLRERARGEIFEQVWAKTGKRWFSPAAVDALEFPYGYTASTHQRYASSLELFEEIAEGMSRRDFDVCLISAGSLGIPLAAFAKKLNRVGISLGGHLQVLFGVLGKRWRERPDWMETYITEAWIDMPAHYRPPETDIADDGAYW